MNLDLKSTPSRTIINFKKMGFKQLYVLGRYNYTRSQRELAEHKHVGMLEICYYDKGRQVFEVEDEKYLVRGGDVFLHYPGEKHSSGGSPEEKGKLYWLIVSASPKKAGAFKNDELSYLCNKLLVRKERHFRGSALLKNILEDIFTTCSSKEDKGINFIRIKVQVQLFFLELLACARRTGKATDNSRINKVLNFIDDNIQEHIGISTLAKKINLSESRFKNFFKEITGLTPGDYIQKKKIEKAIQLIKEDPDCPLSEIAYELNFSTPQYFSTVVKKYTGKSPSSLKEMIAKQNSPRPQRTY